MNIVFCTDSKYLKPTLVSMYSVMDNHDAPISFYILHSDLRSNEIDCVKSFVNKHSKHSSVEIIKVDDNMFAGLPINGRSRVAYFRLLIPKLLNYLDRCLYLDSDTIVNKPLKDFYNMSFEGTALVASEDMGEIIHFHKEMHDILDIPHTYKYFNSGVLLFNLEWFKSFDNDSILKWINEHPHKLKFLDQDVLNANFYDKVRLIDGFSYNYLEILMSHYLPNKGIDEAHIIHFIKKPWKYDYTGVNSKYWWKYGKKVLGTKAYWNFTILNRCFCNALNILLIFLPLPTIKKMYLYLKNNKSSLN